MTRLPLQESWLALNWYELFKSSGLDLAETTGDGVGRFTPADKAMILSALHIRADALAKGGS